MPRVTALTPDRAGNRVLVELDGVSWRLIPTEVAVRIGLAVDSELGREDLRSLRRELRRTEALEVATRALRHRDRSRAALQARLASAGIPAAARAQALDALERAGIVDDDRFATARAARLAARGSGDAMIRAELVDAGVAEEQIAAALADLEPEQERARRLVGVRGESAATARWLARRGFGDDAIEAALPTVVADES